MAQALVCDRCKGVFAKTTHDSPTGKWNWANFVDKNDNRRYRLVYGVFELSATTSALYQRLNKGVEPQGRSLDICQNCVKELVCSDIGREPENDSVPEGGDQGD